MPMSKNCAITGLRLIDARRSSSVKMIGSSAATAAEAGTMDHDLAEMSLAALWIGA